MKILEVNNLVKKYGHFTAVKGISFSIKQGTCFGLLGPNGAGKTTTIEIIEGILKATSGDILYKGEPVSRNFNEEIGIQFQQTSLLRYLTVKETLETFRQLYTNPLSLDELIETCKLEDILSSYNDKISGGQKQRLLLAISLCNNPSLVFLDEPTTGLDPQARRNLWDNINRIKKQNKTVILTTHYMEEAYNLCDYITIVDKGLIIAEGTPDNLLSQHFNGVSIILPLTCQIETIQPQSFSLIKTDSFYELFTENLEKSISELLTHHINLKEMTVRKPNLEDLFIKLTGKDLRG